MLVGRMLAALTWMLGAGSLALFGAFLWTGNVSTIDLRLTTGLLMLWDAFLCLLFFAQHSILVRRSVRAALKRTVPEYLQGVAYTMTSAVALLGVILLWQHSAMNVYALHGAARWPFRVILLLAFAGVVWGIQSLERFDAFGIDMYLAHVRGRQLPPVSMTVDGPYGMVRHPFYAFGIVAVWATPVLSVDRLLFNCLFTGWIYLGARLEERDLLGEFGEHYAFYRKAVPMFLPRSWTPQRAARKAKAASGGRAS